MTTPLRRRKGEEKYPEVLYPPRRFEGDRGSLVWAKIKSSPWWPGILVNPEDCGQNDPSEDCVWVFWIKDARVSQISKTWVCDFKQYYRDFFNNSAPARLMDGILDGIRIAAARSGQNVDGWSNRMLFTWAVNGFISKKTVRQDRSILPDLISSDLLKIRIFREQGTESETQSTTSSTTKISESTKHNPPNDDLNKVRRGRLQMDDICLGCKVLKPVLIKHPFFYGSMCKECADKMREGIYSYGDDGIQTHCAVCASTGTVYICGSADCCRVYCYRCIDLLGAPDARRWIEKQEPWACFYCKPTAKNGLLKPRHGVNHCEMISKLFHRGRVVEFPQRKSHSGMTVLSLFDGIGTGMVVLKKLGIKVEKYYASEIDEDAVNVCKLNHPEVQHIGDITAISNEQILEYQVDLLIGGSPCTELSLVNPARRGMYDIEGSGFLFFEYYRVLTILSKKKPIFWLFENTAAMENRTKEVISRFFHCDPVIIDAAWLSAQNRARFFWGNIPGLGVTMVTDNNTTLDQCLQPGLDREATVRKIRTVTTNPNSLLQGKSKKLAVTMAGHDDHLWITELERIFGLPQHYTDAGNIKLQKRRQMLGKAWSVPVIEHILRPLTAYYKTETSKRKK